MKQQGVMSGRILILFFLICSICPAKSQSLPFDGQKRIWYEASYRGDVVSNTSGGLQTGTSYLGLANLRLLFSSEAFKLWKGGFFYINGANTHGSMPSVDYIGDFQRITNIEAGNHTFLWELFYRQTFDIVDLTLGLQDLNMDYMGTSSGALFLNSSFRTPPTVSSNIPAPEFPLTSLGLSAIWHLSKRSTLLTAVFNGSPTDLEDAGTTNQGIGNDEGFLFNTEYQHALHWGDLPGTYKAGIWVHQHVKEQPEELSARDSVYRNNHGFYVVANQILWRGPTRNRSLSAFSQIGLSLKELNRNNYYVGCGLVYSGLLDLQGRDAIGVAMAHAGLRDEPGHETALELTFKIPLMKYVFIQADIQYVVHPAGTSQTLDNSLATILRFGITF